MIEISRMTESDIPTAAEISRRNSPDPWTESTFVSFFGKSLTAFLVAKEDGKLCGFLIGSMIGEYKSVEILAVDLPYRRKGAATMLMNSFAKLSPNLPISLEVRKHNAAAVAFYEKYGFTKCAVRKKMYNDPPDDGLVYIYEKNTGSNL